MLNNTDLANAVSEGIISSDQAKQLQAFSKRVRSNDDSPLTQEFETRDEPFRLLRGFRDIFISLGVVFLSIGATAIVYYFFGNQTQELDSLTSQNASGFLSSLIGSGLLILLGIGLAEIITKRLRLPLASLNLSVIVAFWFGGLGFSVAGLFGLFDQSIHYTSGSIAAIAFALSAFVGITLFYIRYRLPFIILVIAATLAGFIAALVNAFTPTFFEENIRLLAGLLGFMIFLSAMSFDFRDRLRITRFSECGFWLHLLAAPMMIHAALATSGPPNPTIILSAFTFLTLVALIIDRRAMLVSSLIYLSTAFYQIIQTLNLDNGLQFFIPMGIIGLVVVLLGIGWSPLRRLVMSLIPFPTFKDRLPPVYDGPALPTPQTSEMKA